MFARIASRALVLASFLVAGCAASTEEVASVPSTDLDPQAAVHLKGGKRAAPAFVDLGLALQATGSLSGLGNGDILVHLEVAGQAYSTCANPGGGTQPPGQNPADVTLSGTQAIPSSQIKNGTVKFGLVTGAPPSPVPGAPGCPNAQWSQVVEDVAFSRAAIIVEQGGAAVLALDCSFSPSTADGAVPAQTMTCTGAQ